MNDTVCDISLCILCQKNKNIKVFKAENSRNNIYDAAQIRQDDVYCRLQTLANKGEHYFFNSIFKAYFERRIVKSYTDRYLCI